MNRNVFKFFAYTPFKLNAFDTTDPRCLILLHLLLQFIVLLIKQLIKQFISYWLVLSVITFITVNKTVNNITINKTVHVYFYLSSTLPEQDSVN